MAGAGCAARRGAGACRARTWLISATSESVALYSWIGGAPEEEEKSDRVRHACGAGRARS